MPLHATVYRIRGERTENGLEMLQGLPIIQLFPPKHMIFLFCSSVVAVTLVRPTGCRRPQLMAFVGRCDPQLCSVMNHWQLDRVETLASLRKDSFLRLEAPPSSVTEIQRHRFQLQLSAGPATPATWCIPGAVDWK